MELGNVWILKHGMVKHERKERGELTYAPSQLATVWIRRELTETRAKEYTVENGRNERPSNNPTNRKVQRKSAVLTSSLSHKEGMS